MQRAKIKKDRMTMYDFVMKESYRILRFCTCRFFQNEAVVSEILADSGNNNVR